MTKVQDGPKFILQAVSEILEEYLIDHCQEKITAEKNPKRINDPAYVRDWQTVLKKLLLDQICNIESDKPKELQKAQATSTFEKIETQIDTTKKAQVV
jgi:hypothetical protein